MTGRRRPEDAFAHVNQRPSERADRTVERLRAGLAALQASGQKIAAESLKQVTRELEPGFAGLSFQVIRRNPRAYALYREAADAFSEQAVADKQPRARRRRRIRGPGGRTPPPSHTPLHPSNNTDPVHRILQLQPDL